MHRNDDTDCGKFSSPPCLASELDPTYVDPLAVDPVQAQDVARWRKAERTRLLADRASLTVDGRRALAVAIANHLDQLLAGHFASLKGMTISAWWPIKAEIDLRFWLAALNARGARGALPLVANRGEPLLFREWTPTTRMERGFWNIPVPADGPEIVPDITLAPVVGWDVSAYRLGYGGGYFDRTLAALTPKPFAIGVGAEAAHLPTIFPQPHDIRMQHIVTEDRVFTP